MSFKFIAIGASDVEVQRIARENLLIKKALPVLDR